MAEQAVTKAVEAGVPAPPPDDQNEALIDVKKTFLISVGGAILFVLAALVVILTTRMG